MRTHCRHNHEFTPANTYRNPQGRRICRICKRKAVADCIKRERGGLPPVRRWTEDEKIELRAMWEIGYTTLQIADALNRKFALNMTKNAVIGQAHQMKLTPRPSPIRR